MTIHDSLPVGYRWMTPEEVETWDEIPDAIQVRVGGTDENPWTDLAVPIDDEPNDTFEPDTLAEARGLA